MHSFPARLALALVLVETLAVAVGFSLPAHTSTVGNCVYLVGCLVAGMIAGWWARGY